MAGQLVDKSGDKYETYFMKAEHAKCKIQVVFPFRISRNYDALNEVNSFICVMNISTHCDLWAYYTESNAIYFCPVLLKRTGIKGNLIVVLS